MPAPAPTPMVAVPPAYPPYRSSPDAAVLRAEARELSVDLWIALGALMVGAAIGYTVMHARARDAAR